MSFTGVKRELHQDFTSKWYMDTGKSICLFLFIMPLITKPFQLLGFLVAVTKRCWDRKCKVHLKIDDDDEDNDGVKTRKLI